MKFFKSFFHSSSRGSDSTSVKIKKKQQAITHEQSSNTNTNATSDVRSGTLITPSSNEHTSGDSSVPIQVSSTHGDSEILQLKEDLRHSHQNSDVHKSEIVQLKEKLFLCESEIQQLGEKLHRRNGNIETFNAEISRLNSELVQRENRLASKDQIIAKLEKQIQTQEASRLKLELNKTQECAVNAEKIADLVDTLDYQNEDITTLKKRTEQLENKLKRQAMFIKIERSRMLELEDDFLTVIRLADEKWIKAEMEILKLQKSRDQAEDKIEELEDHIEELEEKIDTYDISTLRSLEQQSKLDMCDVGIQVNSAIIRYGTENNNIKSSAKSGVTGEGDKENYKDNPAVLHANGDFENYREVEKSVIKPLTHADSKRNTLISELDPLGALAQNHGGSRRKALLAWCQQCTSDYEGVGIDDFSTCFSNGMAFCSLLHSYLPNQIPFESLQPENAERNLTIAFKVAESIGVTMKLDISEMLTERPPWQRVMNYLAEMYNCLTVL